MATARSLAALLLALPAAAGCKGSNIVAINQQTDTFVQKGGSQQSETFTQRPGSIDILFAVADNPYMCEKQQKLANAFQQFISALSDGGLDFHIGVVTSDLSGSHSGALLSDGTGATYLTGSTANLVNAFGQVVAKVGSAGTTDAQPLLAAAAALQAPLSTGANAGFLRGEASLAVIVVDDQDDYSILPAPTYVASVSGTTSTVTDPEIAYFDRVFKSLKGPGNDALVSVSAIVGIDPTPTSGPPVAKQCSVTSGELPGCLYPNGDADAAPRIVQVVIDTGGLGQSICQADFSGILSSLGQLLGGLSRQFSLLGTAGSSGEVFESSSLSVQVAAPGAAPQTVAMDASNGWTFNAATQTLQFNGASVPAPGSKITVSFAALQASFPLTYMPLISSLVVTLTAAGKATTVPSATTDPVNGYQYDSKTNAIVFPAANLPPLGSTITVSYST